MSRDLELKLTESLGDMVNGIMDGILEIVDEFIENKEEGDYYTKKYGIVPYEWVDEEGALIGLVYKSNSEETRRLWGDSLTIRMDSDEEDEYSDGEMIDDMNERQHYFH
tara:strand:- start:1140 stop:1466 length:327 start_codon:yes stop_codon:yes gene_type:complete